MESNTELRELRDRFAWAAMGEIIRFAAERGTGQAGETLNSGQEHGLDWNLPVERIAKLAYHLADAMLQARGSSGNDATLSQATDTERDRH